ncbi:MAG: hypothetical protein R3D05_13080 [Dongiaceae bacterium]
MNSLRVTLLTCVVLSLSACDAARAADEFEYGTSYKTASVLPASVISGNHYRIRDTVQSDGFMFTYTVDSDYGTFQVTGDYALQKLLNEIPIIASLEDISRTEAFADSVVHAAKSPLRFGEGLITDPVDTVTGIPRGLFSIFENVGEAVTSESDPSEDSRAKQALFVSSWKRDYCAQLGCDVYSSNKVLQEELNRIAWAAAIGGLTVSGATTVASGGAVMIFSTVRTADQLNEALRAEPPARLRLMNEEKLRAMGIQEALIQKFLDHPTFTPRHDTLIVDALSKLDGVVGRDHFLELCLRAQDEVGANYFQNNAEILVGYHTKVARLTEIVPLLGISAALASNGHTLVPVAWDYGVYEKAVAERMDYAVKEFARRGLSTKFDVWTTGRVSARLKAEAAARGFTVVENIERTIPISQ